VAPPMSPDAFARYVSDESGRYARLVPEIGLSK
jgi:hypothetical protein